MKIKIILILSVIIINLFTMSVSAYSSYSDPFDDLCGFYLIFLIIWFAVGLWAKGDAESRGKNGVSWFLIVFFLGLIGLLIWLATRPTIGISRDIRQLPDRICPNCGRIIPTDARICPYCGKEFWK